MTTSGKYTYSLTLNQILEESFDILQVVGDGETLSGEMRSRGRQSFNLLIKEYQQLGLLLWTYTEGSLFLQVGQSSYDFATANVTNSYLETTLSVAAVATDTSVTLTDITDRSIGDNIGIILQDNNLQWTTIAGFPGGNVVDLNDALTDDALIGATVYSYTSVNPFIPVSRVLDVRRREGTDYEIPIIFESRKDYFNLPNKNQLGTPIQAYYQRGRDNGTMYLWSAPSSSLPVINFTYERELQIMDKPEDTFDFPEEWHYAIITNLAVKLIPKYGASAELAAWIKSEAAEALSLASNFNSAVYPVEFDMQEYG